MSVKNSSHIGAWVAVTLAGFLLSPLMRTGDNMERFVVQEIEQTKAAMGPTVGNKILHFATSIYEATPLASFAQAAKDAAPTESDRQLSMRAAGSGGAVISALGTSYLQGLAFMSYVVSIRIAIVILWMAILAPMLGAAAYDGFMQRKIKRAEFGAVRPATFTVAGLLVIPLLALPMVYLVAPFTLSPLLAPLWAFIVAVPLSILISNMQPFFGR